MPSTKRTAGYDTIRQYQISAMGPRDAYRCPYCGSTDKERLVWLYLTNRLHVQDANKHLRVLHIAPEKNTQQLLRSLPNSTYLAGDKFTESYLDGRYADTKEMDITALELPDNSFDLIICNHVLEHVPDDATGMRELYRVLAPGGQAILQIPISPTLSHTYEDATKTTPHERSAAFGQDDHVRIYGTDYSQRLTAAGFAVSVVPAAEIALRVSEKLGINVKESVYVGAKAP
jgi:SAM-dependent methyltransferase